MSRKCIAICIALLFVGFNVLSTSAAVVDQPIVERKIYDSKDKVSSSDIEVNQKRYMKFSSSGSIVLDDVAKNEREIVFVLDTSGSLKGVIGNNPTPFDYALFSGGYDKFNMQGDSQKVYGKIHANGSVNLSTSNNNFKFEYPTATGPEKKGAIEYIGEATINNNPTNNDMFATGEDIDMPDLFQLLRRPEIIDNTTVKEIKEYFKGEYKDNKTINSSGGTYYIQYTKVTQDVNGYNNKTYHINQDMFHVTGGGTFVVPDKTICWFEGPVFFSTNVKFEGSGIIVADGDVVFTNSSLTTSSPNADSMVYAAKGNILQLTNSANFNGILYAPEGAIDLKGANINVKGSIVAKELNSIPSDLNVTFADGIAKEIIDKVNPPVTYSSQMKSIVKKYIQNIANDTSKVTKVALVHYNVNANKSDEKLYDLTKTDDRDKLVGTDTVKGAIDLIQDTDTDLGKSNLGDGIRKAYKILDTDSNASKTIIVLTGSKPNYWTAKTSTSSSPIYLNTSDVTLDARFREDVSSDNLSNKSMIYAKYMAEKAASNGIVSAFINFLEEPTDTSAVDYNEKHVAWEKVDKAIAEIAAEVFDGKENYTNGDYNPTSNKSLPIIDNLKTKKGLTTLYYKSQSSTLNDDIENIVNINDLEYTLDITSVGLRFVLPIGVKINLNSNFRFGEPVVEKDKNGKDVQRQVIEFNPAGSYGKFSAILSGNKIVDPSDPSKVRIKFDLPDKFINEVRLDGLKFVLLERIGKNDKYNIEFLTGDFKITYNIEYSKKNSISNALDKEGTSVEIYPAPMEYNVFYKIEPN